MHTVKDCWKQLKVGFSEQLASTSSTQGLVNTDDMKFTVPGAVFERSHSGRCSQKSIRLVSGGDGTSKPFIQIRKHTLGGVCFCGNGRTESTWMMCSVKKRFVLFFSCSNYQEQLIYTAHHRLRQPHTYSRTHLHTHFATGMKTAISMHQFIYWGTGRKPKWKMKVQKAQAVCCAQADLAALK